MYVNHCDYKAKYQFGRYKKCWFYKACSLIYSFDCSAMGSHTILIVLCVSLFTVQIALGEVWEFGRSNIPGSVLVAHNKGYMGIFEHTKRINLSVPQCYEMTYVKVQVKNLLSSPEVLFDALHNVVTIYYRALQSSLSSYDVIGQAARRPGCRIAPLKSNYG